jgi:hypothetical protein
MRRLHHIHRDDLMEPDPLIDSVLIVGLLGIVSLLAIIIESFR